MDESVGEAGLLDLLVLVAENLKLFILVPAAAGLTALGLTFVVPQTYSSQAIVELPNSPVVFPQGAVMVVAPVTISPAQAAAMMVSPMVLDSAVESLRLREGRMPGAEGAGLQGRVKVLTGKDNLLRLEAKAPSPKEAQALANAVIDTWLKSTIPTEREREKLQERLAYAQVGLDAVEREIQRVSGAGSAQSRKPADFNEGTGAPMALHQLRAQYLESALAMAWALEGLQRDAVVKQPPTLPAVPVAPNKRLMVTLSVLSALLLVFLWVLLRQAWVRAAQVPESAKKQRRLLTALGLRKTPTP